MQRQWLIDTGHLSSLHNNQVNPDTQVPQVARNRRTRAVDSSVTFNDGDTNGNGNANKQVQESKTPNETTNLLEVESGIFYSLASLKNGPLSIIWIIYVV